MRSRFRSRFFSDIYLFLCSIHLPSRIDFISRHTVRVNVMVNSHLSYRNRSRTEESKQKNEKAEKVNFYLRHKKLNIANLDQVFSESRSGTIAHKNQKRITAGTQYILSSSITKKKSLVARYVPPASWQDGRQRQRQRQQKGQRQRKGQRQQKGQRQCQRQN